MQTSLVICPSGSIEGLKLPHSLVHGVEKGLGFVGVFLLPGGLPFLLLDPVGVVGRRHGPFLLLPGDLD